MLYFAGLIFVAAALLGNLNGFAIKRVLKENGLNVKYFSGHFKDTINILKLAKITQDSRTRKRYYQMGYLDIACGIAFIGASIFLFFNRNLL